MSTSVFSDGGYIVGCDLGQANDFTALCVLDVQTETRLADEKDVQRAFERLRAQGWASLSRYGRQLRGGGVLAGTTSAPREGDVLGAENRYTVRYLERLPLGTTYPAVVDYVRGLLREPQLMESTTQLAVDATGVGRPVIDAMRAAGLRPTPITITGGQQVTRGEAGYRHVPKRDLVGALAVLLQTGRLRISRELRHAERLIEELQNFRVKITTSGNDTYGAWRESLHDDLVLAVAVAVWLGEKTKDNDTGWTVVTR